MSDIMTGERDIKALIGAKLSKLRREPARITHRGQTTSIDGISEQGNALLLLVPRKVWESVTDGDDLTVEIGNLTFATHITSKGPSPWLLVAWPTQLTLQQE